MCPSLHPKTIRKFPSSAHCFAILTNLRNAASCPYLGSRSTPSINRQGGRPVLSLKTLLLSASFIITYIQNFIEVVGRKCKKSTCAWRKKSPQKDITHKLLALSSYQEHQLIFLETMKHHSAQNRDILPCSDIPPLSAGFSLYTGLVLHQRAC